MLTYLFDSLPKGQPRTIPKYRYYINNLKVFLKNKTLQYLEGNTSSYSHGMRLLNQLCSLVDISYMRKFADDVERYAFYLQDLRELMIGKYDTTKTGSVLRRYYITGSSTKEFLISIDDISTLEYLPLNKGWDVWKDVEVMKIWWHPSNEFSLNMVNSKIRFYNDLPDNCVFLIDPIALAFKWYKYQTEGINTLPEDVTTPTLYFFHNFIYNTFQYDLTNIWLLSQLKWLLSVTDYDEVEERKNTDIQVDTQYGKITTTYTEGMKCLWHELELIKNNNLRASSFIHSPILLDNSLYDRMNMTIHRWNVSPSRNFEFLKILKDIDLFEMMFDIYKLNPSSSQYKNLLREFKIQIKRCYNRRPWNNCKNIVLREYIENRIVTLNEKIYSA